MTRRKSSQAAPVVSKWKRTKQQRWSVARLRPNPKARKHPPWQINAIRASLRRFRFCMPLLIHEDGTVIAGDARLLALVAEGFMTAPVIVAPPSWSEADCRGYALLDNELALNNGLPDLEIQSNALLSLLPSIGDTLGLASAFQININCETQEQHDAMMARLRKDGIAG